MPMLTQRLMRLFDWSSSNMVNPSTISDEDLTGEVDEPPDHEPQYCKQAIRKPAPQSSLLTQALSSPEIGPIDRGRYGRESQAISFWSLSGASTAELTSDGGMSSRSHSPSPPLPAMFHTFGRIFQSNKATVATKPEADSVHVVGEDDAIEGLTKRRCIRFACNAGPPSRRSSTDDYPTTTAPEQKPQTTLKFACDEPVKMARQHATSIRFAADPHPIKQASPVISHAPARVATQPIPTPQAVNLETRFHEFASSCEETESWMIQIPDKTRLLSVDGVLAKEKNIRQLSEEVEAEVRQEEEEAEELDQIAEEDEDEEGYEDEFADWEEEEEDDEDDEDEEEDEDDNEDEEEDEEEVDEYLSGNESDNEEGFASDSDDSDGSFFGYPRRPGYPLPLLQKPQTVSPFFADSHIDQHPTGIELPDSTDFVCGTFDEDKALEDAYACALVEQKRAKYGITPQDIDPSFPSEESDSEEEYCIKSPGSQEHAWTRGRMSFSEEDAPRGKKIHSILAREKTSNDGKIRFNSPAPQRRAHSPAPKRRIVSPPPPTQRGFKTTPPLSRRNSNDHSPRPAISRRGSRALSPPPPTRNISHLNFTRGHIERTKSLPKGTKISMRSFGYHTQANSDETPAVRTRGAIDIVKGLEKKRERRRNKLARQRASYTRKGEGVEKMRELGLMLGKGKQAQWMISV